jgi:hypothetical protein
VRGCSCRATADHWQTLTLGCPVYDEPSNTNSEYRAAVHSCKRRQEWDKAAEGAVAHRVESF